MDWHITIDQKRLNLSKYSTLIKWHGMAEGIIILKEHCIRLKVVIYADSVQNPSDVGPGTKLLKKYYHDQLDGGNRSRLNTKVYLT